MQLNALFRLGFPSAPGLPSLNLAARHDSQAHSTKGTPPPFRAATACGSMVSGSLSLPSRGAFHLSLTVLCAIGRYLCFALEGGPPGFPRGFSCPAVLWCCLSLFHFRLHGFHILRHSFPGISANGLVRMAVLNPGKVSFTGLGLGPVRSPLLGVSRLITLPRAT